MLSSKKWVILALAATVLCFVLFALPTVIIDPLFHYHGPLDSMQYALDNERYQNDGIMRHFDYNALITGSSMTQNYKSSDFDRLWGTKSIKVSYSGGGLKEIGSAVKRAGERNGGLEYVLWGLDLWQLKEDKDWSQYNYPEFLCDDNPFNDAEYVLNKELLIDYTWLRTLAYTDSGGVTTPFDVYKNWMYGREFGREKAMASYTHRPRAREQQLFDEAAAKKLRENVEQNIIPAVIARQDIEYYIYFSPFSILWWDESAGNGLLEYYLSMAEYTAELLLPYENVKLFSFFNEYDLICDLDLFMDTAHFHEDINSQLLVWMKEGKNRLTEDNFEECFQQMREFYGSYDYEEFAK